MVRISNTPTKTILIGILIAASIATLSMKPALVSANFTGVKWPANVSTIRWKYHGNHTYLGNAWQGAANWNATSFSKNLSQANSGQVVDLFDRWWPLNSAYAQATWYSTDGIISAGDIEFNTSKMGPLSDFNRTKVATHEFGHIIGLAHTASSGPNSVMKQGILPYNTPQTYDKNNVTSL